MPHRVHSSIPSQVANSGRRLPDIESKPQREWTRLLVDTVPGRFIILWCVFAIPLLRFILQNRYGILHPEIFTLFGAAAVGIFLLSLITANTKFLSLIVAFAILILSASTLRQSIQPLVVSEVRFRHIWAVLVPITFLLMYTMRRYCFVIIIVFMCGACGTDMVISYAAKASYRPVSDLHGILSKPLPHILYIILDEHVGSAGWPTDIPESQEAKAVVEGTFLKNGFELYPNAYSNYDDTLDSVGSILNFEIEKKPRQFVSEQANQYVLQQNRLLDALASSYKVNIYRSNYITMATRNARVGARVVYPGNSIRAMLWTQQSVFSKIKQIVATYIQSDALLNDMSRRLNVNRQYVGPLALTEVWPNLVLRDILTAQTKTLFIAHLLSPHFPYVYRRDGTVRPRESWSMPHRTYDTELFREEQRRYAEQVEFLHKQIAYVFQTLRDHGLLDEMTIIVHGDHGSRIRLLDPAQESRIQAMAVRTSAVQADSRYDYPGPPPREDLLHRFSALMAIKRPHSKTGKVNPRQVSVVQILYDIIQPAGVAPPKGADSVYLFDPDGTPHPIPATTMQSPESMELPPMG